MKIAIASDHRGINEKQMLIEGLRNIGHEVIDCSQNNSEQDDYPDYAFVVGNLVAKNESDIGILLCGSGIGMSIAANKVKGIRCARVVNIEEAISAREHNCANVIAMSSNFNIDQLAKIINAFITTPLATEERHQRRISKIIKIENGEYNNV